MQLQSYMKFNVNYNFLHYTYHVLRGRNLNTIGLNINYIFYKIRTSVYTFDLSNRNDNSKLRRINQISHSIPKSNFDRITSLFRFILHNVTSAFVPILSRSKIN